MERYVVVVIYLIFAFTSTLAIKRYRNDYEYNSKTDAFYKLHTERIYYIVEAGEVCNAEGGELIMPNATEDIAQLLAMLKRFPDIGDLVWMYNDRTPHKHITLKDYIRLMDYCDVVTREGVIETEYCYASLPFICKVESKDVLYDSQCDVYTSGFKYLSSIGSCYKVPQLACTWNEAYEECRAQGAHLVVLNSEAEHLAVKEFLHTAPPVEYSSDDYSFWAGIFGNVPHTDGSARVFRTVFNETLMMEADYSEWTPDEINLIYQNSGSCGVISKVDGKYYAADCSDEYGYICEKEAPVMV